MQVGQDYRIPEFSTTGRVIAAMAAIQSRIGINPIRAAASFLLGDAFVMVLLPV